MPETMLLYQLVEQHYPAFRVLRAAADRPLPDYPQQEFDAYLKCGRLAEGFLRVRCEQCHAEKLVGFSGRSLLASLPPVRLTNCPEHSVGKACTPEYVQEEVRLPCNVTLDVDRKLFGEPLLELAIFQRFPRIAAKTVANGEMIRQSSIALHAHI